LALDAATRRHNSKLAAKRGTHRKDAGGHTAPLSTRAAAQRLLILGAGKKDKFGTAELRKLAGTAVRTLKSKQVKRLAFFVRDGDRSAEAAQAVVEGLILANFDSDKYKTDKKPGNEITAAAITGWEESSRGDADRGLERGRTLGESQNFARELGNEPANYLTPRMLASRAEAMAREAGLSVGNFGREKDRSTQDGSFAFRGAG